MRFEFLLIKGNISPLFTSVAVTESASVAATMLVSPVPDASSRTLLPCTNSCLASRKSESSRAPRHTCKCVSLFSKSNLPDYHLEPHKVNTAACAMRYCNRGEGNVVVPWSHFKCCLHIWENGFIQEFLLHFTLTSFLFFILISRVKEMVLYSLQWEVFPYFRTNNCHWASVKCKGITAIWMSNFQL